jgi:hypothetical protein
MTIAYDIGDAETITGTFTIGSTPTDPDSVVLLLLSPDGVETTLTFGVDSGLIKQSIGVYQYVLSFTQAGRWWWKWIGTGAAAVASEGFYDVRVSQFV